MSKFSGKCDLYDHIMMQKHYQSETNPNVYVSDEMECFELFKKATGGVIYQDVKLIVSELNQELVSELCDYFHYHPVPKKSDRSKQKFIYRYFGKEMSLKELNKKGIYVSVPIHFKTLLDIIPYYPYLVTCAISNNGKQRITISSKSYVDTQAQEYLNYGHLPCIDYRKFLQEHYIEVVTRYFNPDAEGRRITKTFKIKSDSDLSNFRIWEALDENWDIEVVRDNHSWIYSSPRVVDADNGILDISQVWPNEKLDSITLTYVKKPEKKLYLE